MARSFHVVHGYAVVGVALAGSMLKDAYERARDVCELFPQFEFVPTFQDEILLHHTALPLLETRVSTVAVLAALLAGFAATHFGLIELLWLFLVDLFSGRWLYNLVCVHIPAWLPFLASEPGVPDLLSDPEDTECLDSDGVAINGTSAAACLAAMAKLVEVKLQHENCTIERPDGWLVFDPEEDELVPKKDFEARRLRRALGSASSTASSSSSASTSTASPTGSPSKPKPQPSSHTDRDDAIDDEGVRPESPTRRNR